ncbi:MAG: MATE family efflux transporter, partial [Desulfovibrio sp.]
STAVSQSLGAGLPKRARRYSGMSLILALVFSALLLSVAFPLKRPVVSLLQVPQELTDITDYFLGVYLLVIPAYYLLLITNAVFRARKWVHVPLASMILITVVNAIGDFGLGLGMWGLPELGYKGVAWATFGSVLAGTIFNMTVLWRTGFLTRDAFPPLRWIKRAFRFLFKVAWPAGAMQILWNTASMVTFAIVASLPLAPVDAMAGMTAGLRIEAILFLPGFAFNLTASILTGHLLGAGKPEEAKRTGLRILALACGSISLFGGVVWIFAPELAVLVSPEPGVQAQIIDYLFYNILAIPFTVATMTMGGIMTGAGATVYNLTIFGISAWLLRLPTAYIMGHHIWQDSSGVWVAMLISQIFQSSVMFCVFLFGNWQRFAMRTGRNARTSPAPSPNQITPGAAKNAPTV